MQLINKWGECPPDGYRYVDPVSGFLAHAWTYVDWINVERAHLAANNREIPDTLELDMQKQLCEVLPPGFCHYENPEKSRPSVSLTWNDVAAGAATFARWIAKGCQYVSQSEADRRALICTRCYLNVNVAGCSGCQKTVQEIVRNKNSHYDSSLGTCAVCKCFLRAKVHFPLATLDTESEKVQEMYPDFCWLNKESPNYRG